MTFLKNLLLLLSVIVLYFLIEGSQQDVQALNLSTYVKSKLNLPTPKRLTKTVVTIDGITKELNESTSCDLPNWKKKPENSCRCCLIKHTYNVMPLDKEKANKALQGCKAKKYCTVQALAEIAYSPETGKEKFDPNDALVLVKQVQSENLNLPEIEIDPKLLGKNGELDVKTAIILLKASAENGLLKKDNESFKNPDCLSVKKLGEGGYSTTQLFGISIKQECMKEGDPFKRKFQYILKETNQKSKETRNLVQIRNSDLSKFDMYKTDRPKNYAAIAFDEQSLVYSDGKKKRYMILLDGAPGKPLYTIVEEFAKKIAAGDHKEIEDAAVNLKAIFFKVGEGLSRLHQMKIGGKTPVHGDLHMQNVFAGENHQITLIDNETFAQSLIKSRSPALDLWTLYGYSTFTNKEGFGISKEIPMTLWHEVMFIPFVEGYISAYAPSLRKSKYQELRKLFLHQGATTFLKEFLKEGHLNPLNLTKLPGIQSKYTRPALDKIEKDLFGGKQPIPQ